MKIKRILTTMTISTLFSFASCKKDYSCKCSDIQAPTIVVTIHDTKGGAQKQCEEKIYFNGGCKLE